MLGSHVVLVITLHYAGGSRLLCIEQDEWELVTRNTIQYNTIFIMLHLSMEDFGHDQSKS